MRSRSAIPQPIEPDTERAEQLRRLGALLFAAPGPVSVNRLAGTLPDSDLDLLLTALDARVASVGLMVRRSAAGVELVTDPGLKAFLTGGHVRPRELSAAALEVVAAIARLQPCARSDVAKLRGTEVSAATMRQLQDYGWIARRGKKAGPGGASLWVTTDVFLSAFGLQDLAELDAD